MAYTDIDKPSDYFNTVLYTGNGGTQSITGVGFQTDWSWIKRRDGSAFHVVTDSVRGATKQIYPNDNQAEGTRAQGLQSFDSDGYTLGNEGDTNASSSTYVGWNWKAGTSFTNDASATGIGSMDSAGSVNEEAGFAIVSYTGNETASTLKHGLSTVPQMIIVKGLISARDWIVGHHTQGWTKSAMLNETTAYSNQTHWNNTAPTSSVFTIEGGSNSNVNTNNAGYIAYIFSERKGYSKFSSYVGNGSSSGTYVHLGFKPAFIIQKNTSSADAWVMFDNKRNGYNTAGNEKLYPNASTAEADVSEIDFLSNGFKLRAGGNQNNNNGEVYIYMAFAEQPFVTSTGVPATAR